MRIYLSSTLNDLKPERAAVKEALSGFHTVVESYDADEKSVSASCVADVKGCGLYIAIVGLRYGFIPPGESKSITELEFEAAGAAGMERLVFLKDPAAISAPDTDAYTGEHGPERVRDFRAWLNSAVPGIPRPAVFSSAEELKHKLLRTMMRRIEADRSDPPDLDAAAKGPADGVASGVAPTPPPPGSGQPHNPVAPPPPIEHQPPTWDQWRESARIGLQGGFERPVFVKLDKLVAPLRAELDVAFGGNDPATIGEACVDALVKCVDDCLHALQEGAVTLASAERRAARSGFLSAMRAAARLCLDPSRLQAHGLDPNGRIGPILDVPARSVAGATLASRARPDESWRVRKHPILGIPVLEDVHAHEVPIELGSAKDARRELEKMAVASVAGPLKLGAQLDDKARGEFRAYAISEAKAGRARLLVIPGPLPDDLRAEIQDWIYRTLGVHLMCLHEPQSASSELYLCDEQALLAQICRFLAVLDSPEWSAP